MLVTVWYTYQTVTYIEWHTRCRTDTINSPDDEHECSKHVEIGINIYEKRNVRQVGHLQEYY